MVSFGNTITKQFHKRFPNAIKIEYILDGYWDVTFDEGIGEVVRSYRLVNGKLVHFATVEMEN